MPPVDQGLARQPAGNLSECRDAVVVLHPAFSCLACAHTFLRALDLLSRISMSSAIVSHCSRRTSHWFFSTGVLHRSATRRHCSACWRYCSALNASGILLPHPDTTLCNEFSRRWFRVPVLRPRIICAPLLDNFGGL